MQAWRRGDSRVTSLAHERLPSLAALVHSVPCDVGQRGEVAFQSLGDFDSNRVDGSAGASDGEARGWLHALRIERDQLNRPTRHLEKRPDLFQDFFNALL